MASTPETPALLDLQDGRLSPGLAALELSKRSPGLSEAGIELAGFSDVSMRGVAIMQLLGEAGDGVAFDATPAANGARLRITHVRSAAGVRASGEIDLVPSGAALCRATLAGVEVACVIRVGVVSETNNLLAAAHRAHDEFVSAAAVYSAQRLLRLRAGSPALSTLGPHDREIERRPWGRLAIAHR